MDETLKRNIRESLVYALQQVPDRLKKRLVISEFFHSLNRKGLLLNHEVEGLIKDAYQQIIALEDEPELCPKCGKPFEVVALATDYYIIGCPEHREFDQIHKY